MGERPAGPQQSRRIGMDRAQRQAADEMACILRGLDDLNAALVKDEDLRLDNWEHFTATYDRLSAGIPHALRQWQIACGQLVMAL